MCKGKYKSEISHQKDMKYIHIIDISQFESKNMKFSYILLCHFGNHLYLCIKIKNNTNNMTRTYTYFSMVPTSKFQQQNQNNQNLNNQTLNACCVNLPVG
jgi:hypothetical protein